ncbi:hypotheitcal protein [Vibrio variabilis]|uniref:Hypotheitcal protein n=1 Tax=Vibrio variabilis TaxID=990271 RepID=A0ABQ0J865_9VIBR|nr:hypotheitcal protein [Vibrio variabilis]
MRSRTLVVIAALSGLISVGLGAFAAHGLKNLLSPYLLGVFETGVTYQFIHTLALLLCALFALNTPILNAQKAFHRAAICFIIGILFFSGSLYALALTGVKWFGLLLHWAG